MCGIGTKTEEIQNKLIKSSVEVEDGILPRGFKTVATADDSVQNSG
jgi:hypothetical protein